MSYTDALRQRRLSEPAPPLVKARSGASAPGSGTVTDAYDLETDPIGARWMPYTTLLVSNYSSAGSLELTIGATTVDDPAEYQIPPQSQLALTDQRIVRLAVRRDDTTAYRLTLRRDDALQELH